MANPMQTMQKRILFEITRIIIYGGVGAFIGIISFTLITIELRKARGHVVHFGDCKITAFPSNEPNKKRSQELAISKKGNIPFLWGYADNDGEARELVITDGVEPNNIVFNVNSSGLNQRWTHATYGSVKGNCELYLDIDFNGQFDVRTISDPNGNYIQKIFCNGEWLLVDKFKKRSAHISDKLYLFDSMVGWNLQLQNIEHEDSNRPAGAVD